MAEPRRLATTSSDSKSLAVLISELWELVVAYFKQETVEPLKSLSRFVAFGVAGAVCLSLGFVLVGVGVLRAIQFETGDHLTEHLSWLAYLIVALGSLMVAGLVASRIGKVPRGQQR